MNRLLPATDRTPNGYLVFWIWLPIWTLGAIAGHFAENHSGLAGIAAGFTLALLGMWLTRHKPGTEAL